VDAQGSLKRTSRGFLTSERSEEGHQAVRPLPGQAAAVGAPAAQEKNGWTEDFWRQEAGFLFVRVQELEGQLRRRTLVLGSSLGLLMGAAASMAVAILFSLTPLQQRPQLAAPSPVEQPVRSTPTAVDETLPVPLVVAAQPIRQAGDPGPPMVQPLAREQTLDPVRRAEVDSLTAASKHNAIAPVARRIEPRGAHPMPTAEAQVLLPSPVRANEPADATSAASSLRAALSDVKRHMSSASELPKPPLIALKAREPILEERSLPAEEALPPPVAPGAVRTGPPDARR
jgi:hypothetical protein